MFRVMALPVNTLETRRCYGKSVVRRGPCTATFGTVIAYLAVEEARCVALTTLHCILYIVLH